MGNCRRIALFAACAALLALASAGQAGAATYTNPEPITIPAGAPGATSGGAAPYPSVIPVSLPGSLKKLRVTLNGFSHTHPDDVDVLLAGPAGSQVTLLMADACGPDPVGPLTVTFDDDSPFFIPDASECDQGTIWVPANYAGPENFPAGVPPPSGATYDADLPKFRFGPAAGNWRLFVSDDAGGGSGSVAGGWTLELLTDTPCGRDVAPDFEYLGTDAPDLLTGNSAIDILIGLGGRDKLNGRGGDDLACGGAAKDKLIGGFGNDILIGGPGKDRLKGGVGIDVCRGGPGRDKLSGCESAKKPNSPVAPPESTEE